MRKLEELLLKLKHYDKDERYIASHDIITELEAMTTVLDPSFQVG